MYQFPKANRIKVKTSFDDFNKVQDTCTDYDQDLSVQDAIQVFADVETLMEVNSNVGKPIMVYANNDEPITPRDIIARVNSTVSDSMAGCYISDSRYLSLFQEALAEFLLIRGDMRYNPFIAHLPLRLIPGQDTYTLPSNFDTRINLWVDKKCCLYTQHRKFRFVPREAWSENVDYYTYTTVGRELMVYLPDSDCQRACDACSIPPCWHLDFEYYFLPQQVKNLSEPIYWLPSHLAAQEYLVELLKERVYRLNKQMYVSETKQYYRDALIQYCNGLNNVDANPRMGRKLFKFRKY